MRGAGRAAAGPAAPAPGASGAITADDLAGRLAGLDPVGVSPSGAVNRLAWTQADAATGAWFAEQAARAGLRADRDAAGNRWAVPEAPGPWWGLGSHLDSVRDGGRLDGPLGVAAAFAVAEQASRPVAVLAFADEEGARFNTPTFGSRALTGVLDVADALARRDDDGVSMAEAMRAAGVDPEGVGDAPQRLARLRGFLELHIDQSRELDAAGAPWGVVSALASRLRVRATFRGRADHAGTTSMAERADALAAAARAIAGAVDAAGELRVTPGRLLVRPNALTTIAEEVRLWLDARGPDSAALDAWQAEVQELAAAAGEPGGVAATVTQESRSPGVAFDSGLRARLRARGAPELLCWAGHDAGVLARVMPAAMVLVRNPTGVSHAPAESVDLADAAAAAAALLALVEAL